MSAIPFPIETVDGDIAAPHVSSGFGFEIRKSVTPMSFLIEGTVVTCKSWVVVDFDDNLNIQDGEFT
ncbi:hypothetical protein B0G71_0319 [Paraburkholderia sp. BL27I4N3]|uniref:hypothetical protein n=1 Tax=Paraburkholderia sp. BL27I4N3 TaxID=1938805 RepID=UPI000E25D94C|nr:hypothetical protein [Paraburkholderia sp. BL27I4N3]REE17374.1 hypothetical protein B0G71_0319 [Paraburkholderia sp. BL27I4N3]